jgi:trimethylamine--corrinoid protein Co-methyltransferase
MSNYLDIPMFGTAGCTDAKLVDEQAAVENAISVMMSAQSGANLIHDVGYIEHGNTASLENLVICDELVGYARMLTRGIEVSEETLALDVIDSVGPGGNFLMEEHTLRHFKTETWYPDLFERKIYENWVKEGKKTLTQRANEKVIDILENYKPEPLPADVQKKIRDILDRAENRILK